MAHAESLAVRIARRQTEALDIDSFELEALDGSALPAFSAGSHVDVHLPNGIVRQYSLCNDPAQTHRYLIAVLHAKDSRGGSVAMHDLQEGQTLVISRPRNHFALAHDAKRSILLAGGIGITPILCMAERLAITGAEFALHYCSRSPERAAFVQHIRNAPYSSKVHFHFDDGATAQALNLGAVVQAAQAGTHLYVCGPQGFMDAVLKQARAHGWPESHLHYEYFAAPDQSVEGNVAFDVQLASSGRVITVAKDVSISQALSAAGVDIATACEQGVCGTCLTRVISGTPEHRDTYLTPEERAANDQLTPCCSRSRTPLLVLDL